MLAKSEIAAMVRKHLDGEKLGDIYFEVDEPGILTGEGWVRIPVRPSHLPRKLSQLYDFLTDKSDEIYETEQVEIMLLSGEALFENEPQAAVAVAS